MASFLDVLGLIPGVLVIIVVGILTTYTDYIVGTFKLAHPEVYTLAEYVKRLESLHERHAHTTVLAS